MKKLLAIALFLSASVNAYAVDGGAVLGGALGGAAGAAIGYKVGGQTGAILGAAVGGGTGAAVGSRSDAQAVQAAPVRSDKGEGDEHRNHDNGRHLGQQEHKHHHED